MCGLKLYTDRMLQLSGIAERLCSGGIFYTNKIGLFTVINIISAVGEEALDRLCCRLALVTLYLLLFRCSCLLRNSFTLVSSCKTAYIQ